MSEKHHPNLHAIGMLADIADSLSKRLRGMGLINRPAIMKVCMDDIQEFVQKLENTIDRQITYENRKK